MLKNAEDPDIPVSLQEQKHASTWTIGQIAEEFGLTLRTLRYYEDQGMVSPQRRGTARLYDYRDHARLVLIMRGKRLGFSLAEIKAFLSLYNPDNHQIEQMRYLATIAHDRIDSLEQQLKDVTLMLAELRRIETDINTHLQKTPPLNISTENTPPGKET